MVRCERLDNGRRKVTAVANFTARIVRDLIRDDDAETGREFAVELRSRALPTASHARLPTALAELQSGWEI